MKAITFLGVRPQTALYTMNGKEYAASQFGVALARFIPNLTLRALVTKKALDEQYPAFERDVEDYVADVRAVPITDGKDADELWQLFDSVVDQIEENEEVIFDITHGFRSLPFLAFLAAAYVRVVKRAQIKGVYYANYDAGFGDPRQVPVVDLTEFVALLDWMIAADLFVRRGDSGRLAHLMRSGFNAAPEARDQQQDAFLSNIADHMEVLSRSLRLIRPDEVMQSSAEIGKSLNEGAVKFTERARPFVPLVEQVADAYRPLALAEPGTDPIAALAIERDLVHWYLDRGYLVQATAVAREWLVTWAMLQCGAVKKQRQRFYREQMENAITGQLEKFRENPKPTVFDLSALPGRDELVSLFDTLGNVRNDLLHAGKRPKPQPGDSLESEIREYCGKLTDFPLNQQLNPSP